MSRPLRIAYPGAYYHVTCRGNERKDTFNDDSDRSFFLDKLQNSLEIYGARLHAFVLMSNHFHFIVETPKANLSEFMRHFLISYTGAFNRRHNRAGHLFQGRYKALLVEKDSYLLELSRYVHLNPVRIRSRHDATFEEQIRELEGYRWSSLGGYLQIEKWLPWIVYDEVLSQIGGLRKGYREFVEDGLKLGYKTPWAELKSQVILGKENFLKNLQDNAQGNSQASKREQPSLKEFRAVEPARVVTSVAAYFGLEEEQIAKKRTQYRNERAMAMELIYRYSGLTQTDIGLRLGGLGLCHGEP